MIKSLCWIVLKDVHRSDEIVCFLACKEKIGLETQYKEQPSFLCGKTLLFIYNSQYDFKKSYDILVSYLRDSEISYYALIMQNLDTRQVLTSLEDNIFNKKNIPNYLRLVK